MSEADFDPYAHAMLGGDDEPYSEGVRRGHVERIAPDQLSPGMFAAVVDGRQGASRAVWRKVERVKVRRQGVDVWWTPDDPRIAYFMTRIKAGAQVMVLVAEGDAR